ncbi:MAG: ABC transporter substrate-binding protein [Luteolibacter sp.]
MKSRLFVEKNTPIRIGFVSQLDCAPIVVAHETGIFARHGLDNIRLSRELGWGVVREKISHGHLDASQAIAGMAIGLGLGLGMSRRSVTVPLILSLEGNAITLSKEISRDKIGIGNGLQEFLSYEWKKERPMILAVPHRFSSHHSLLSTWLERNGVSNPDNLELISLPSFLMPRLLKAGHIDGFCAPEPWNSEAVMDGNGWCPATSSDIASGHPESTFMVSGEFMEHNKATVVSIVTALIESCRLCQETGFREELVSILSRREYLDSPAKVLWNSLGSDFNSGVERTPNKEFQRFSGGDTNRPGIDKASWVLATLRKEGTIPNLTGGSLSTIFREDIYMAAERALSVKTHPQNISDIDPENPWSGRETENSDELKWGKLEEASNSQLI